MNIVFCLPGREFSGQFLQCWSNLLYWCFQVGIKASISQRYSSNVYYVRSLCLGADVLRGLHQVPFNNSIQYDYIMWIDSDITFTPNNFETLLKSQKDIISGLYLMENASQYPCVEKWDVEYFKKNGTFQFLTPNDMLLRKEPFEVTYNGMGFMLIKRGVYENINYPWFSPETVQLSENIVDFASEDVSFCLKAIRQGYKIYVDPTVVLGHEKMKTLF